MVRAWYMDDNLLTDQRLEHHRSPVVFIDLDALFELTGVKYFKVCQYICNNIFLDYIFKYDNCIF